MSIAVAGGYGVGMTMRVATAPGAGETVTGGELSIGHGGKGSNQAVAAARLGAQVSFLTSLGNDSSGETAKAFWASEGIDSSRVVERDLPTMTGFIVVDASGENRITIAPGALTELTAADAESFRPQIRAADTVLVSLEIPVETAAQTLRIAREEGVRTILNPAPALELPADMLALVDVLTPNLSEANILLGNSSESQPNLARAARELQLRTRGTVVITAGSEGAWVDDGLTGYSVPAVTGITALDTTGAGDAFTAALGVALSEGREMRAAVEFAAHSGARAVTIADVIPALATREELDSFIHSHAATKS